MIHDRLDALEKTQADLTKTLASLDTTIASLHGFLTTWEALQGAHKTATALGNAIVWLVKAAGATLIVWGAFKFVLVI